MKTYLNVNIMTSTCIVALPGNEAAALMFFMALVIARTQRFCCFTSTAQVTPPLG